MPVYPFLLEKEKVKLVKKFWVINLSQNHVDTLSMKQYQHSCNKLLSNKN